MKRGNTEVVSGPSQAAKKAKIEDFAPPTMVNDGMLQGSSSSTPNQDQTDGWTKVEKRKKKKEIKLLDGKRDVRYYAFFFLFFSHHKPGFLFRTVFIHHASCR